MPDVLSLADAIGTEIDGVYVVQPTLHGDERGLFIETYRRQWFPNSREMIQSNRSNKQAGALVGLHYHLHQADYWYVPMGTARVVLHDLREGGPTDGNTACFDISWCRLTRSAPIHRHWALLQTNWSRSCAGWTIS